LGPVPSTKYTCLYEDRLGLEKALFKEAIIKGIGTFLLSLIVIIFI
jgi:hypothetical protein